MKLLSDLDTILETRTACAQEQYFDLLINLLNIQAWM